MTCEAEEVKEFEVLYPKDIPERYAKFRERVILNSEKTLERDFNEMVNKVNNSLIKTNGCADVRYSLWKETSYKKLLAKIIDHFNSLGWNIIEGSYDSYQVHVRVFNDEQFKKHKKRQLIGYGVAAGFLLTFGLTVYLKVEGIV